MPESPLQVARRFDELLAREDAEAIFELLTEDAEWATHHRTLRGREEIRAELRVTEPPANLDVEVERGKWADDGAGRVVRESRVVQRWKETGEIAAVMLVREELEVQNGKIRVYSRRARPEQP